MTFGGGKMCSLKIKKNKKREEVGRKLSGVGLSGLNSTKVYFVLTEQATNGGCSSTAPVGCFDWKQKVIFFAVVMKKGYFWVKIH